ncbi:hypothetical protein L6164_007633 [Bauhinia variegata]|uniref:Uncharacterized protein n=1 Tax=Bauhinia variegata TaxID=167791 RepID=A0ACB9PEH9_BAUVA|nr:hypothetical protein L6164_007633 [Bauhinia variegata]
MSPASATNSTLGLTGTSGFHNLSSPFPYLFGGLAIILSLIGVALLILACSYRSPSSAAVGDEEKSTKMVKKEGDEYESRIVVIMAGDTNPTYLANPVISSSSHTEQITV